MIRCVIIERERALTADRDREDLPGELEHRVREMAADAQDRQVDPEEAEEVEEPPPLLDLEKQR